MEKLLRSPLKTASRFLCSAFLYRTDVCSSCVKQAILLISELIAQALSQRFILHLSLLLVVTDSSRGKASAVATAALCSYLNPDRSSSMEITCPKQGYTSLKFGELLTKSILCCSKIGGHHYRSSGMQPMKPQVNRGAGEMEILELPPKMLGRTTHNSPL